MSEGLEIEKLRARLEEEERRYAQLLAALDGLASFSLPFEARPALPEKLKELNEAWRTVPPPGGHKPGAFWARRVRGAVAPALEHQEHFNAVAVQVLNDFIDESAALDARLRDVVAAIVHYAQTVLPTIDARDRMATALATTRSELILETFDRRQETLARRIDALATSGDPALTRTPLPLLFLDLRQGEAVSVLDSQGGGSLGTVSADVTDGPAPAVLTAAYRALRPGGVLRLQPGSGVSVDALRTAVQNAGFTDVQVEPRGSVDALAPIPTDGLPAATAQALNENVARLNALLGHSRDTTLTARR